MPVDPARMVSRQTRALPRGWLRAAQVAVVLLATAGSAEPGAAPLRVALIAGAEPPAVQAEASLMQLQAALDREPDTSVNKVLPPADGKAMPSLSGLRMTDAAVLLGGTGQLLGADAALLREFLARGGGLLVLRENTSGWDEWPDFVPAVLGAKRQGVFAGGAPMRVINLFAHAVFTGVPQLETGESMPLYETLAGDVMLIMEGTVGESTAPLGWLRRSGNGRAAHVLPAAPELFRQPEYLRLLVNLVRWVARRPIPGAPPLVQRTYLPNAYPGAMAIVFPGGPMVCFDPARGGVSQVSDADFIDLRPRWLTKTGQPARVAGELFYLDPGRESFWRTASGDAATFKFEGYRLGAAYVELHYRIGQRGIRERLRRTPDATAGLVRELHVGAGSEPLSYRQQPTNRTLLSVRGAVADAAGFSYQSREAGTIEITIQPSAEAAP